MKYMSKKTSHRLIVFCALLVFSLILFFARKGGRIWDDYKYHRLSPTDLSLVAIDGNRLGDIATENWGRNTKEDGVSRTVEKNGDIVALVTRDVNRVFIDDQLMFSETLASRNLKTQLIRSLGNRFVYEHKEYTYLDPENNIAFEIRDDYKNNEFVFSLNQYDTFINHGIRSSFLSDEWYSLSRNPFMYILVSALFAPFSIFLSDAMTLMTALLIAPALSPLICLLIPSTRSSSKPKNIGLTAAYAVYFFIGIISMFMAITAP